MDQFKFNRLCWFLGIFPRLLVSSLVSPPSTCCSRQKGKYLVTFPHREHHTYNPPWPFIPWARIQDAAVTFSYVWSDCAMTQRSAPRLLHFNVSYPDIWKAPQSSFKSLPAAARVYLCPVLKHNTGRNNFCTKSTSSWAAGKQISL